MYPQQKLILKLDSAYLEQKSRAKTRKFHCLNITFQFCAVIFLLLYHIYPILESFLWINVRLIQIGLRVS